MNIRLLLVFIPLLLSKSAQAGEGLQCLKKKYLKANEILKQQLPIIHSTLTELRETKNFVIPWKHESIETGLYPVIGPIKFARQLIKTARSGTKEEFYSLPFRFAWKEKKYITGSIIFSYINSNFIVNHIVFDEKTDEFYNKLDKEIYVMANLIPPNDRLAAVPKFEYMRVYRDKKKTFFVNANNAKDLETKLYDIQEKYGQIYGLEIISHGSPGIVSGLPSIELGYFDSHRFALKKDGVLKLTSCQVARGKKGKEYLNQIGEKLLPAGGRIYASEKRISSNLYSQLLHSEAKLPLEISQQIELAIKYSTQSVNFTIAYSLLFNALFTLVDDAPFIEKYEDIIIHDVPSQNRILDPERYE